MCICIHGNMRGPSRSLDGNCILSRGSATGQRSQIERLLILRPQRPKSKNSLMMPNMVGLPALHKYGQKAFRDRGGTVLTFCQFCPALCHRFTPLSAPPPPSFSAVTWLPALELFASICNYTGQSHWFALGLRFCLSPNGVVSLGTIGEPTNLDKEFSVVCRCVCFK